MSESFLRYTDLATAIQLARAKGLTTRQIVRALTANMTYTRGARGSAASGAAVGDQDERVYKPAPKRVSATLLPLFG